MNKHSHLRRLGVSAALVGVAALVTGAGAAPADVAPAGTNTPTIGPKGVGAVKLGKRYVTLRRQGLVGKIRPGCELGGPNTRSAPLKRPLRGSVDLTRTSTRKVRNITITRGGRTARGIAIGSTLEQIQTAYPGADVDRNTEEVFQFTLVTVPKSDGGRFQFAVSTETGKTVAIGIPGIAVCE
jgi:hypothetical protein